MNPPFGPEVFVKTGLGVSLEGWRQMVRDSPDGMPFSQHPDSHAHPLLGITVHWHGENVRPHTHMPKLEWDTGTQIMLEGL